jgi:hypothetical protein
LGFLRTPQKNKAEKIKSNKKTVDQRWQRCVSSGVNFRSGTSSFYNSNRRISSVSYSLTLCVPGGVWSGRDASQELHTLLPPIDWKGGYGGGVEWFVSDGSMFDFRLSCCIWQTTGPLVLLLFQHLSRKGKE